jgi:hypothetical protein
LDEIIKKIENVPLSLTLGDQISPEKISSVFLFVCSLFNLKAQHQSTSLHEYPYKYLVEKKSLNQLISPLFPSQKQGLFLDAEVLYTNNPPV